MFLYNVSFISRDSKRVVQVQATSPGEALAKAGPVKEGESVTIEEVKEQR